MERNRMRIAVAGCGVISDIYLKNLTGMFRDYVEVVACCDIQEEKAETRAAQYNIEKRTIEQILEDKSIQMVIVLTPAPVHYGLIKQCLEAGKHVYTEKTMTVALEQAQELVALANEKGLYLGAAPDTFMGASLQKARELIDAGTLGEITSFLVCSNRNLDSLTSRYNFLRLPGGGICYDYGVYYLTALVSLLGPIYRVGAVVENRKPVRTNVNPNSPDFGKPFDYPNEGQVTALLTTESGINGTFILNGESIAHDLGVFSIYGTKGVLRLANPNFFGGDLELLQSGSKGLETQIVANDLPFANNNRGLGPTEMALAIEAGKTNRASKEQAFHILDVIERIMESSATGQFVTVHSRCALPEPLNGALG